MTGYNLTRYDLAMRCVQSPEIMHKHKVDVEVGVGVEVGLGLGASGVAYIHTYCP